jgi:hypothetical protein
MRKRNSFVLAAVCAAALTASSYGQDANAPAAPQTPAAPPAAAPQPPVAPRPNPQMRLFSVRNSIGSLDRVIADLKRSENDFDGHKQSALDACVKAREELVAVAKAAGIPLPPVRQPGRPMPVPPAGGQQAAPAPAQPAPPPSQ